MLAAGNAAPGRLFFLAALCCDQPLRALIYWCGEGTTRGGAVLLRASPTPFVFGSWRTEERTQRKVLMRMARRYRLRRYCTIMPISALLAEERGRIFAKRNDAARNPKKEERVRNLQKWQENWSVEIEATQ